MISNYIMFFTGRASVTGNHFWLRPKKPNFCYLDILEQFSNFRKY